MLHNARSRGAAAAVCGLLWVAALAQIPTKCLEIESVLADACNGTCPGAQEGENEMFRFITGPNPIPLAQLVAQWATPNNFLGWTQSSMTASVTAQLNATITNCGWLLEPPAGIIPAGKRVLGMTSPNLCITGNSFAELSDTLYVIYQTAGNTFGHFKNTNDIGALSNFPIGVQSFRTFILRVNSPLCSDSLTYNVAMLVNQYGTYGGSYLENDGSSLLASWPGTPQISYVNYGCQAPIVPFAVQIVTQPDPQPCGGSVQISAVTTGNVVSTYWHGGAGSFNPVNGTTTTYTLAASETSGALIWFCAVSACGDTLCNMTQVQVLAGPVPSVSVTSDPLPCGSSTPVSASVSGTSTSTFWQGGAGTFANPAALNTTYTLGSGEAGVVPLSFCAVGSCGDTICAPFQLNVQGAPSTSINASGPNTICQGSTVTLTATGGTSYEWSSGEQTAAITVGTAGTYTVTTTNACGQATASVDVAVTPGPTALLSGPATACPGETIELIASGGTSYLWSNGATTASTEVSGPGTYAVTVTAACGADQISTTVGPGEELQPTFTIAGTEGCAPVCAVLVAEDLGAVSYNWSYSDGASGTGVSVEHCFQAGYHSVSLTVAPLDGDPHCPGTITELDVIHASPVPVARFSINPTAVTTEDPLVRFYDQSTGATNWLWRFNAFNDSTSTEPSPELRFDSVACYPILLEVTNDVGCTSTATNEICVEDPFSIWVPNAFTPNGDDVNETFFAVTTVREPAHFELSIFDRWGSIVFTADKPTAGWDGSGVPNGVYVWKVWIKDTRGFNHQQVGHVVLVR